MRLGGNNRSISVGGIKEVKFRKVSRRSRANEFNDARGRAPNDPQNQRKLRGNKSLSDREDKQHKAAPQTVCWLKTNER